MPKLPKRFVVVQVAGQFYELERPYGAECIQVLVHVVDGMVNRVWIEACPTPKAEGMANPYIEEDDE